MDITVSTIPEQPILGMHEVVALADLPEFFGRAYSAVFAELVRQGVAPVGTPVAMYDTNVGATADVTAGFRTPVAVSPSDGLVAVALPGGRAVEAIHEGPYDALERTYGAVMEWFVAHDVAAGAVMWEEYLAGPPEAPDPAD